MATGKLVARLKSEGGFSLIEMTIVVAVMAVLASSAVPLYELHVKREKEHELRVGLRQIREAIDAYKRAVHDGRIARKADESEYPRKLEDLVTGVPDIKNPEKRKIYFLRRLPRDPMSEDHHYPPLKPGGNVLMKAHPIILRKATMFSTYFPVLKLLG